MRRSLLVAVCLFAAWGALGTTSSALAGFAASVTGQGELIAPPPSVVPGAHPDDDYIVFDESSGVLLSSVTLDQSGADPGGFNGLSTFTPITLDAGTPYGSTLIQLDPEQAGTVHSGTAVVHFSSPILGLAFRGESLDATDVYGAPGTTYPTGFSPPFPDTRGIDFRKNDKFTISGNGLTLVVNLTANNFGFDQIRVFTEGSAIPEPQSLMVWSLMAAVVMGGSWMRRRSRVV